MSLLIPQMKISTFHCKNQLTSTKNTKWAQLLMAYSISFFFGKCRDLQTVFGCMQILNLNLYEFNFIEKGEQLRNIDLYLIIGNEHTLPKTNNNSIHEGNKHIKIVKDVRLKINDAWFNTNIRFYLQDLLGE